MINYMKSDAAELLELQALYKKKLHQLNKERVIAVDPAEQVRLEHGITEIYEELTAIDEQLSIAGLARKASELRREISLPCRVSSMLETEEKIVNFIDFPSLEFGFHNQDKALNTIVENRNIIKAFYISAPAGYGKSALLKKLTDHFSNILDYQCFYAKADQLILEDNYAVFDKNRFFAFDSVETADDKTLLWLSTFINKLIRSAGGNCCVVLSGRYLHTGSFERLGLSERIYQQELCALNKAHIKNYIQQAVTKCGLTFTYKQFEYWADKINGLSCGHPGIIYDLVYSLKEGRQNDGRSWDVEFAQNEEEEYLFKNIVSPRIRKIVDLSDPYIKAFSVLSIFSCFDLSIIQGMQSIGEISREIEPLEFLRDTRLICEVDKDNGFFADSLFRNLLLKELALISPDKYINLIKNAKLMLDGLVENLNLQMLSSESIHHVGIIDTKKAYARQYLYLSMQMARSKEEAIATFHKDYDDIIRTKFMLPKRFFLIEDKSGIQRVMEKYGINKTDLMADYSGSH